MTQKELNEKLGDRWWRLNNLYYIKDENGNKILFKPASRQAQKELYEGLWFFNIIPKARQLGITTFFCIFYLDQILFSKNKTCTIIAHTERDMKKIFRNKIKFAWDNLHPWLKENIGTPDTNTANELSFPNGSVISVALSSRSDTVQFLHISEFGYICQKYPEKAEEIVKGAINAVHAGNFVSIESTAAGREGYFYEFCMDADKNKMQGKKLTPLEFKIFFFPWWIDPRYHLNDDSIIIDQESREYFNSLEKKDGIVLTDSQKRWYIQKKKLNRDGIYAEYPSTLDEAFRANLEGQIYKEEMKQVYNDKRIRSLPYDKKYEIDTWWDLGWGDFTVILLTQTVGGQIRFIDMYWNHRQPLDHYYSWLKDRKELYGYRYRFHHLPHDAAVTDLNSGVSREEALRRLGLYGIKIGRKIGIADGIEGVRNLFPRFYFDEEKCKKLSEATFNYRFEFDHKLGIFKKNPRHDESSHFCDPLRLLSEFWREQPLMSDMEMEQMSGQGSQSQSFFS